MPHPKSLGNVLWSAIVRPMSVAYLRSYKKIRLFVLFEANFPCCPEARLRLSADSTSIWHSLELNSSSFSYGWDTPSPTQHTQYLQTIYKKIDFQHSRNSARPVMMLKLAEMWQKTIDFRQLQRNFSKKLCPI